MMLRCRWFSLARCRHVDVDLGFGHSKMQHSEVLSRITVGIFSYFHWRMADNFQFKNQYPVYHIHNLKARTFRPLSASKAFTVLETLYCNLKKIVQRNPRKVTFKSKYKTLI